MFSLHYWQESFDGDSFVSQSTFDAKLELHTLKRRFATMHGLQSTKRRTKKRREILGSVMHTLFFYKNKVYKNIEAQNG